MPPGPAPRAMHSSDNSHDRGPWDLGLMRRRLSRRAALRRSYRKTDNLLVLQLANEAGNFVLGHRLAAELQPKHAALGTVDDGGLIIVEQRRDVGDTRLRRESNQRARRRAGSQIAGPGLVHT